MAQPELNVPTLYGYALDFLLTALAGISVCYRISRPTQRAPDLRQSTPEPWWWESARFQTVCVAPSWFRQNGVVSSRPPAGNASRWAANESRAHQRNDVLRHANSSESV